MASDEAARKFLEAEGSKKANPARELVKALRSHSHAWECVVRQ